MRETYRGGAFHPALEDLTQKSRTINTPSLKAALQGQGVHPLVATAATLPTSPQTQRARTHCRPVYEANESILDVGRTEHLVGMDVSEFKTAKPLLCAFIAKLSMQQQVNMLCYKLSCYDVGVAWYELRLQASVACAGNSAVTVCVTEDFQLWLLNEGESAITLPSCELFGFNVGVMQEKLAGGSSADA